MPPTAPTDAELDTMIRARLAAMGTDLAQLPPGSTPDPVTGSPGQVSVLTSLRAFVRGTVAQLSAYQLPGPDGSTDPLLSQQGPAPLLYPSIVSAWTPP